MLERAYEKFGFPMEILQTALKAGGLEDMNKAQITPEGGAPSCGELNGEELLKAALADESVKEAVISEISPKRRAKYRRLTAR